MVTLIQNKAQLYLKLTRIKSQGENGTSFLKKKKCFVLNRYSKSSLVSEVLKFHGIIEPIKVFAILTQNPEIGLYKKKKNFRRK